MMDLFPMHKYLSSEFKNQSNKQKQKNNIKKQIKKGKKIFSKFISQAKYRKRQFKEKEIKLKRFSTSFLLK